MGYFGPLFHVPEHYPVENSFTSLPGTINKDAKKEEKYEGPISSNTFTMFHVPEHYPVETSFASLPGTINNDAKKEEKNEDNVTCDVVCNFCIVFCFHQVFQWVISPAKGAVC